MTIPRHAAFWALGLIVAGCGPMPGGAGWPDAPALGPGAYVIQNPVVIGLTGAETLPEAAAAIQRRFALEGPVEGNYRETVQSHVRETRGAVIMTQTGLPDDSVRGVQHVVEFDLRPDAGQPDRMLAVATGYGTRQTCYRAADPDAWTSDPCP